MTKPPESDALDPKADTPFGVPQPWKDDEDEIPSFEGMVFSSYVDPADLTGDSGKSAQPIPEMPLTIWEDPPLTEDEVLQVIASSTPRSEPADISEDEAAEPAGDESSSLEPIEEDPAPLGRGAQNAEHRSLYGNLADSSWVGKEWLQPVQSSRPEEFIDHAAFYTKEVKDLRTEEQASGVQSIAHAEPVKSAEAPVGENQAVHQASAPSSRQAEPMPHPISTGEVTGHDREAEPADQVITDVSERPLFKSWYEPEAKAPDSTRIPNFGHLVVLALLGFAGLVGAILLMRAALYYHLFGISTVQQASTDIHYTIGFMASLYLISFGLAMLVFPLMWHKSLFAGLQWNFASTWQPRRMLILLSAAFVCFLLAMVDELVLPGPANAPIDKLFDSRAAAWMLFAFGVSFAPFFEEIVFRGFLLPALCTSFDWYGEKLTGDTAPPLDPGGYPHWSITSMTLASIATSIPFALMHAEQTAWSLGPFLLLVAVSLVLCWARLATRSLAASVIVHASYNLLLFSLMLLGTGGFRHLDKM